MTQRSPEPNQKAPFAALLLFSNATMLFFLGLLALDPPFTQIAMIVSGGLMGWGGLQFIRWQRKQNPGSDK